MRISSSSQVKDGIKEGKPQEKGVVTGAGKVRTEGRRLRELTTKD